MKERIGIFGGTFDPVHTGHLIMAETAFEEFSLDKVILLPAGNPPHKPDREGASGQQRYEMLRLAAEGNDHFTVSDYEIHKKEKNYTFETLGYFRTVYPDSFLLFIMGGDSLHDFPKWKNPGIICSLAEIAVAVRNNDSIEEFSELIEQRSREFNGKIHMLTMPNIDISSSGIRSSVKEGRSIRYYVPDKVAEYIYDNGLYIKKNV